MQPNLLRTPDAARYVGLSGSTLEKMRIAGDAQFTKKPAAKSWSIAPKIWMSG